MTNVGSNRLIHKNWSIGGHNLELKSQNHKTLTKTLALTLNNTSRQTAPSSFSTITTKIEATISSLKTVSGKVISTTPISLSDAAKSLSKFAASDHEASHAVSLYLQRAADSFNHLVKVHQKLSSNSVKKEDFNDDIEISESRYDQKKNREVGLKVENVVKNEDTPNGSRESKKSKNLVKEENMEADTKGNKTKNSSKIDKVKDQKLVKTEHRLDIGEGETEKFNKNELEFVKIDKELELKEVEEYGMTSRDKKKKKKKKDRGVGDSRHEVGKVEEDLGNKAEEEGKKRKRMDPDAGENAGSIEQRSKKKSKMRRIEGEK